MASKQKVSKSKTIIEDSKVEEPEYILPELEKNNDNNQYSAIISNFSYALSLKKNNPNGVVGKEIFHMEQLEKHFLTYEGLNKRAINEIHKCFKYAMKGNKSSPNPMDYIDQIKFDYVLQYLEHVNRLDQLNEYRQEVIYMVLSNNFKGGDYGDIYKPLSFYKKGIDELLSTTYTKDGKLVELKDLFEPPLSFNKFQKYLVFHSKNHFYQATYHNRVIEHNIYKTIQEKSTTIDCEVPLYIIQKFNRDCDAIKLNKQQLKTIKDCLQNSISFIQGSGGTGKTTILRVLQQYFNYYEEQSLYLAIATKAKQVIEMKLSQDMNSSTSSKFKVMTMAKFQFSERHQSVFNILHGNTHIKPIYDNIIVDEASMIGNMDFLRVLYKFSKRVILVGDTKQILPVLQWGNPFQALQTCEFINRCYLTKVCRQAEENPLSSFIEHVVDGKDYEVPEYDGEEYGVFYVTYDDKKFDEKFANLYMQFKDQDMGCIKCAKIDPVNKYIQEKINGEAEPIYKDKYNTFYEGDHVMRTNNQTIKCNGKTFEIANGEKGMIYLIKDPKTQMIDSNKYLVEYKLKSEIINKRELVSNIKLSYVSTSHKYQGSENDVILFNFHNNYNLSNQFAEGRKNLFYTSITRAKKLLLIVGTESEKFLIDAIIRCDFSKTMDDFKNEKLQTCAL
jgi:uncharacterized protein (DUF4213/DUF364 family)